ncbi:MAG: hypothetical protein FD131_4606 [Rhodocyclaceae bacterium]|nr:MAG: hypothetical protein FD131_4606 [Rhodocyclaceae bacterium]
MEVSVTEFCFNNPAGGTAISDGSFNNEPYPHKTTKVVTVKGWLDYECGWRFIGLSADPLLTAYLEAHGHAVDRRVFFSEFDLADRRDLGPLIDFANSQCQ